MKKHIILSLLLALFVNAWAQFDEPSDEASDGIVLEFEPEIDFMDHSIFDDNYVPSPQERSQEKVLWKKQIWRVIDMREQINYPYYFPTQEVNGRKNLFSTCFDLLLEGKVEAYDFIVEKEDFGPQMKVTKEEIIDACQIYMTDDMRQIDDNGDTVYIIDETDVPSDAVLKYYMKEVWYFDAMEACMKFKIEAIAPQLSYEDEDGQPMKAVLFWIPFDQLRPHLAKQSVVINNKNSTSFVSFDDLFQKRRFSGRIYKEDNIYNRIITQYCNTPEEVRSEQNRIESEVLTFELDLWEY